MKQQWIAQLSSSNEKTNDLIEFVLFVFLNFFKSWKLNFLEFFNDRIIPINTSSNHVIKFSFCQIIKLTSYQLINLSIHQIINLSSNQLINLSWNQVINLWSSQLIISSSNQLIKLSSNQIVQLSNKQVEFLSFERESPFPTNKFISSYPERLPFQIIESQIYHRRINPHPHKKLTNHFILPQSFW